MIFTTLFITTIQTTIQSVWAASQVHIGMADAETATVSFVAHSTIIRVLWGDATTQNQIQSKGTRYSTLLYIEPQLYAPSMGAPDVTKQELEEYTTTKTNSKFSKGFLPYTKQKSYYMSPYIHTVLLHGLKPGSKYWYDIEGVKYKFQFPKNKYPFVLGVTGDLGQTPVSNQSVYKLAELEPDVVLIPGDLSYADGWGPLWDSFGELVRPLGCTTPILTVPGNHESYAENWLHYTSRWPSPKSESPLYWSVNVGPAHIVGLNSYDLSLYQQFWLKQDLESVNRKRTPWLIVMMHVPFYNSNLAHQNEGDEAKLLFEDLFFKYSVDIVFCGHIHAYESTYRMYNSSIDPLGPVYINIGTGGNREGLHTGWFNPKPDWSRTRETSFGIGALTLLDSNKAYFEWHRHACGDTVYPYYDLDKHCTPLTNSSYMLYEQIVVTRNGLQTLYKNSNKSSKNSTRILLTVFSVIGFLSLVTITCYSILCITDTD